MNYLKNICLRLKAIVPRYFDDFSLSDTATIRAGEGVITLINPIVNYQSGDIVTIVGANVTIEKDGIATEHINYSHILTAENEFRIKQEYISFDVDNAKVHRDIKILIVGSEALAFEHYKKETENIIFIIPAGAKGSKTSSFSSNADIEVVRESFLILIYLRSDDDLLQHENISKVLEIRDIIIRSMVQFKIKYLEHENMEHSTIEFQQSQFVFNTANSLVYRLEFDFSKIYQPISQDWQYELEFDNPKVEKITNI